jgi:uncharacterized protein
MRYCDHNPGARIFIGWRKVSMIGKATVLILFACIFCALAAQAGVVQVPGASLGSMNVKLTSLKEQRFKSTVQQQYDFSCGSAALATLLTFHYDDKVTEADVFKVMYDNGNKEKIRREGFSLLDMKNMLEKRGYKADGFSISLDKLHDIGVPAIALINNKGFKHFTVIKGVTEKDVLLGDPALGTRVVARQEFETTWNGLVFLVRNKKDVAERHFNQPSDWPSRGRIENIMPLTSGQLLNMTLFLPVASGL